MAKRITKSIRSLISDIPSLRKFGPDSHEYKLWKEKVDAIYRSHYGENSTKYKEIHESPYSTLEFLPNGDFGLDHSSVEFIKDLDTQKRHLEALLFDAELNEDDNEEDALSIVMTVLRNFPKFALQIGRRHEDRKSIEFNDEYDVQDALHAILLLHFESVKREEPIPHSAGASSSIDFLLRKEKIGIEVKMPREGLKDGKLGSQLAEDKERYKKEEDLKTLIFFVYDPSHHIKNPTEIIEDISGHVYGMDVHVVFAPTL